MSTQKPSTFTTPSAIIMAGLIIAGSILFNGSQERATLVAAVGSVQEQGIVEQAQDEQPANNAIAPKGQLSVVEGDHVFGNPKAEYTIIEYSDFECPFCGRIHPTLERLTQERSDVKWVYRHLPLSIHKHARSSAIASECIAQLGGNDMFWSFSSHLFSQQRSLNAKLYQDFATANGISIQQFENCVDNPDTAEIVADHMQQAQSLGGQGTPFSVLIDGSGNVLRTMPGALPYETFAQVMHDVAGPDK